MRHLRAGGRCRSSFVRLLFCFSAMNGCEMGDGYPCTPLMTMNNDGRAAGRMRGCRYGRYALYGRGS